MFILIILLGGCAVSSGSTSSLYEANEHPDSGKASEEELISITPTSDIKQLESDLYTVRFEGDDKFEDFLDQGGASTDGEVVTFLAENLLSGTDLRFLEDLFGCSTIAVKNPQGDVLFGRNFDWDNCEAMIVASYPDSGYASFSTVNMNFIDQGAKGIAALALQMDQVKTLAALYAPLDGMNEKGLAVSVNMIQDSAIIDQRTEKPDLTTTTAIRLLLNKAADVDEAIQLLSGYDMHASMGMMVHFALADAAGRSVVVEYVDNEMIVTDTPAVTNFYFAKGEKQGIGTEQSHERYEILMDRLSRTDSMDMTDVRNVLDRVSKKNFNEFESTEWSIVFNLGMGQARYYHREHYETGYLFILEKGGSTDE